MLSEILPRQYVLQDKDIKKMPYHIVNLYSKTKYHQIPVYCQKLRKISCYDILAISPSPRKLKRWLTAADVSMSDTELAVRISDKETCEMCCMLIVV